MPGMWDDNAGQSASLSDGGLAYPPLVETVDASSAAVTLTSLYARNGYAIRAVVAYDRLADRVTAAEVCWMRPVAVPVWTIPLDTAPAAGLPDDATLSQILDALVATRELLMVGAALIFDLSTFG